MIWLAQNGPFEADCITLGMIRVNSPLRSSNQLVDRLKDLVFGPRREQKVLLYFWEKRVSYRSDGIIYLNGCYTELKMNSALVQ